MPGGDGTPLIRALTAAGDGADCGGTVGTRDRAARATLVVLVALIALAARTVGMAPAGRTEPAIWMAPTAPTGRTVRAVRTAPAATT